MTARQLKDVHVEETAKAGVYRRRRIDIVEKWLRTGVISDAQHAAATNFALTFEAAAMRERYTLSKWEADRVDGGKGNTENLTQRMLKARDRMRDAANLLGPSMWPVTSDVLGSGISLREHAWRSDQRRRVSELEARGRLIAALDLLDRHWV